MKVTAFVGSARKKHTYNAAEQFLRNLKTLVDVESELVVLDDYKLEICKGCMLCLNKGEELCPLKDDRDKLIAKIADSDGIILATPNYSFSVSGQMKVFLDRLGFIFHRPRFFGKAFTGIVVQGVYGGKKINEYLSFIGGAMWFNVVNGICLNTCEPIPDAIRVENDRILDRQSRKFYAVLAKKELRSPSFFELMMFRMARTNIKNQLDETWRDYTYYRDKGWFASDFFYPVRLNPLKKLAGWFFDRTAAKRLRSNK